MGFFNALDITDIILIFTSIFAIILGSIGFVAYKRDGRTKLLFVTAAFFTVALKGALIIGGDFLSVEESLLDVIAHLLDFVVLLLFFIGMLKR